MDRGDIGTQKEREKNQLKHYKWKSNLNFFLKKETLQVTPVESYEGPCPWRGLYLGHIISKSLI